MLKYIGSKRRLVPVLGELCGRARARTALDLFTGTTRVAQEFKRRGAHVTAVDTARYSQALAQCYVATDADAVDPRALDQALARLAALPGTDGYVTRTFCRDARYFHPDNGRRIDAIRDAIEADHPEGDPLRPLLLTSLLEAADRVDSTTGVQMAYLKAWAPRALKPLELRAPVLLRGTGRAERSDAREAASGLPAVDLAYLDPPYNQHSYYRNYHAWETLVAWDAPGHYGIACKRDDCRDPATRSAFNSRGTFVPALGALLAEVDARLLVLSYNDESWVTLEELLELCSQRGEVRALGFDSKRYVGAQIGIHDLAGRRVGTVGRLRNVEYLVVAGAPADVHRVTDGMAGTAPPAARPDRPPAAA